MDKRSIKDRVYEGYMEKTYRVYDKHITRDRKKKIRVAQSRGIDKKENNFKRGKIAFYDFPGVAHDTLSSNPLSPLLFIHQDPFNALLDIGVMTIRIDGHTEMVRQNDDGKGFWFLSLSFTMSVQISQPVVVLLFLSISPAPPSITASTSSSPPP